MIQFEKDCPPIRKSEGSLFNVRFQNASSAMERIAAVSR